MSFVDGFVIAVPHANKDQFVAHARHFDEMLMAEGALRVVECWGVDVQPGQHTDFRRAVDAREDEAVCFSWVEWPDRATRDAAHARFAEKMASGEWAEDAGAQPDMPFDGKRLVFGGFEPVLVLGS
ncbi:DUF1428 domain-containing protein [Novosphingobium flavum]|uniref:DUF1428 domain-containing protein n=1 Tax=Novosphingobium aerophilum TaxID=2839843 RepID=UPI00163A2473|nr:DUF1428 domain-containing protein [Novosphingobium aerophilum]MBC2663206.1 DUF1428 domain-containing protein [Novosphingobium aerophilum]